MDVSVRRKKKTKMDVTIRRKKKTKMDVTIRRNKDSKVVINREVYDTMRSMQAVNELSKTETRNVKRNVETSKTKRMWKHLKSIVENLKRMGRSSGGKAISIMLIIVLLATVGSGGVKCAKRFMAPGIDIDNISQEVQKRGYVDAFSTFFGTLKDIRDAIGSGVKASYAAILDNIYSFIKLTIAKATCSILGIQAAVSMVKPLPIPMKALEKISVAGQENVLRRIVRQSEYARSGKQPLNVICVLPRGAGIARVRETAGSFAQDVQASLPSEHVHVYDASGGYGFEKFVYNHIARYGNGIFVAVLEDIDHLVLLGMLHNGGEVSQKSGKPISTGTSIFIFFARKPSESDWLSSPIVWDPFHGENTSGLSVTKKAVLARIYKMVSTK